MPTAVKIFNDCSAELGELKISLRIVKLDKPTFSFGKRKKITIISKILIIKPIGFNIFLIDIKILNIFSDH